MSIFIRRSPSEAAGLDQPQHLGWRQPLFEHLLLDPAGVARQIAVLATRRPALADALEEQPVEAVTVVELGDLDRVDGEVVGSVEEPIERLDRELDLVARRRSQHADLRLSQQDQLRAGQSIFSPGEPPGQEAVVERHGGVRKTSAVRAQEIGEVGNVANIGPDGIR